MAPCCGQVFPCRHCHNEATVGLLFFFFSDQDFVIVSMMLLSSHAEGDLSVLLEPCILLSLEGALDVLKKYRVVLSVAIERSILSSLVFETIGRFS